MSVDNMQFGFMPGKGTTYAIFIMRQIQEKHQEMKLYYAFMDLEKAFDRVPREVGMDEWLIRTVMPLYTVVYTVVKTDAGLSESFYVILRTCN